MMSDIAAATATQLRNIEAATGLTVADFTARVDEAGLEKHGQVVAFLKSQLGLTHGNANLIATLVGQARAGGPPPSDELLAAQYQGGKAQLRPILDRVTDIATGLGDDVERVVLKTGVSFRRRKQFALVEPKSSTRVQLGLNLDREPDDPRVVPMGGMCTHKVDLAEVAQVDASIERVVRSAYEAAG
jgi:predicted transport protein